MTASENKAAGKPALRELAREIFEYFKGKPSYSITNGVRVTHPSPPTDAIDKAWVEAKLEAFLAQPATETERSLKCATTVNGGTTLSESCGRVAANVTKRSDEVAPLTPESPPICRCGNPGCSGTHMVESDAMRIKEKMTAAELSRSSATQDFSLGAAGSDLLGEATLPEEKSAPFSRRCLCKSCEKYRRVERIRDGGTLEELRHLIDELANHAAYAECDAQYYGAILDGSWPTAIEQLTEALAKAKKESSGDVVGTRPENAAYAPTSADRTGGETEGLHRVAEVPERVTLRQGEIPTPTEQIPSAGTQSEPEAAPLGVNISRENLRERILRDPDYEVEAGLTFSETPESPAGFTKGQTANYAWLDGKYYTLNHPDCVRKLCEAYVAMFASPCAIPRSAESILRWCTNQDEEWGTRLEQLTQLLKAHVNAETRRLREELERAKREHYVWAGTNSFTGEEVLGLLRENEELRAATKSAFCDKHRPSQGRQYGGCVVCSRNEETEQVEEVLRSFGWAVDEEATYNSRGPGQWWYCVGDEERGSWPTADALNKAMEDYDSLRDAHKQAHIYGAGQQTRAEQAESALAQARRGAYKDLTMAAQLFRGKGMLGTGRQFDKLAEAYKGAAHASEEPR